LAVAIHRQISDVKALALQPATRVEHGSMFRRTGNYMTAVLPLHMGDALESQIIALSGATGEDNLSGIRANQAGNFVASVLDCSFRFPAENMVTAGGVAVMLGEIGQHRLEDTRIGAGGGVVIQVDRQVWH